MKLLNICLAALTAASANALLVEISEPEIRAAKDASAFIRELSSEEGPKSLVLVEENLFVHAVLNATGVTTSLVVDWEIESSGVVYNFPAFTISKDGLYSLDSEFGFETDVNWVKVTGRGDQEIEVRAVVNGTVFDAATTVYTINDFQTVLPLLSLVVLALISRNVYVAMFFGIWIGSLVIEKGDVVESFRALFDKHIFPSVLDEYNFRTITFTLFLAGFIAMIKHSGGQEGFSRSVARIARSARTTQFAAILGGIGLFFDDYSSALILGSSFRKLTDAYYVSREKLAFIVDSTSAPIASFAPISSWIAFELGRIKPELDNLRINSRFQESAKTLPDEYTFFLNTLASRYYSIYMVVIQIVLVAAAVEFGPMLYAERKCRIGKRTDGGDGATDLQLAADITDPAPDTPRLACNFFVPLLFFITSLLGSLVTIGVSNIESANEEALENGDLGDILPSPFPVKDIFGNSDSFFALVYTTMGASLFTLIFYLIQAKKDGRWILTNPAILIKAFDCRVKKLEDVASSENLAVKEHERTQDQPAPSEARPLVYFIEGINVWIEGFKNLVPSILILCLAFTIKSIVKGCATDRFFTDIIVNGDLPASSLPTIIFIIASFLSFCTGTSFGTMSIMFPLVGFATFEKAEGDVELYTIAMSAILAGAIFGDHCSPISDTTILSCIGSGCSIGAHVITQIPYALWGALFSIVFGTLPAGSGWNKGGVMVLGFLAITFGTLLVGAPIVSKSGRLDQFSELYLLVTKNKSLKALKVKSQVFATENPELVNGDPLQCLKFIVTLGFLRNGRREAQYAMPKQEENEVVVKQDADVAVVVAENKEGHSL